MGLDDPDRVLSYLIFGTAFQVHPCRYPVIGIRSVFDQLSHADVLKYYRRRYLPNNVFLVVVGDVDTGAGAIRVGRASWIRQTRAAGASDSSRRTSSIGSSGDDAKL